MVLYSTRTYHTNFKYIFVMFILCIIYKNVYNYNILLIKSIMTNFYFLISCLTENGVTNAYIVFTSWNQM